MESYKREFIAFLQDAGVLKFGDFTAKSGRKQIELCFTRTESNFITANDPVPLMKKLGRRIGETKEY